ncbi:MAG: metallophosphoesterase family protein [Desulfuromonadales bacterium]|nr:metallophosphoesterase family protein [Desulfuromonadales bacterium]
MTRADRKKTIRIGVLSDTHLHATGEALAYLGDLVERVLAPVDMILHAGDLLDPDLLHVFGDCPVHAVRGNMDEASPGIPVQKVLRVNAFTIGLMHGWGPRHGLERRIREAFSGVTLNCLVYGHSHQPRCEVVDGLLLFNPGSATDRRSMPFHSVGLLEVDNRLRGSIIRLD